MTDLAAPNAPTPNGDRDKEASAASREGRVVAVRGPVIDAAFEEGSLPSINEALRMDGPSGDLFAEVQSHVDEGTVRAVALQTTSGLQRGIRVTATGSAVTVPVGDAVLGRLINVTGTIGDGGPAFAPDVPRRPIHREPPPLDEQSVATAMFETGITGIDLLRPLAPGG